VPRELQAKHLVSLTLVPWRASVNIRDRIDRLVIPNWRADETMANRICARDNDMKKPINTRSISEFSCRQEVEVGSTVSSNCHACVMPWRPINCLAQEAHDAPANDTIASTRASGRGGHPGTYDATGTIESIPATTA